MRLGLVVVVLLAAVTCIGGAAPIWAAPNPCRAACKTAKVSCLAAAKAAFLATKTTCPTSQPDRRACLKAARMARAAARRTCKSSLRTCKMACGGGGGPGGTACGSQGDWLTVVNLYRGLAALPPVTEDTALSAADLKHAEYMVKTNTIMHSEDSGSPFYTPEGDQAAHNSDLAGISTPTEDDSWAVDLLMRGPFHSVGIIDSRLATSGFGIAHDNDGSLQTAAALNVLSGLASVPPAEVQFPVLFPGNGTTVPLNDYPGGESPDPLTSCPGYTKPNGLPLVIQLGTGSNTPAVSAHSLSRGGAALDHCLFDETTYTNPDGSAQTTGRAVLGARNAIVLIPKVVLTPGTYDVSITTGAQTINWSFTVTCH